MTLDRDSSESSAFVIEPEDIKRLIDFLENGFAKVDFTLKCSDKLSRNMSVDELLVYENSKAKQIKTLTLSNTYSAGNRVRITVTVGGNFFISISGDYDAVAKANEFINEWIESLRPWYWRLAHVAKLNSLIGYLVSAILIGSVLSLLQTYLSRFEVTTNLEGLDYYWLLYISIVLPFFVALTLLYKSAFPAGEFAIGQGAKRFRNRELFRQIVVGGVVVSVISSVIYSFF